MPVYNVPTAIQSSYGSYTGNGPSANRSIPHGLGTIPKLVIVVRPGTGQIWYLHYDTGKLILASSGSEVSVTAMDSSNFYIDAGGSEANFNAASYEWIAIP